MIIGYIYIAKDKDDNLRLFTQKPSILKVEKTERKYIGEVDHYGNEIRSDVGTGEYEEVLGYVDDIDCFKHVDKGIIINQDYFSNNLLNRMKYGDEPIILNKLWM